jgi:hypothetical protein
MTAPIKRAHRATFPQKTFGFKTGLLKRLMIVENSRMESKFNGVQIRAVLK